MKQWIIIRGGIIHGVSSGLAVVVITHLTGMVTTEAQDLLGYLEAQDKQPGVGEVQLVRNDWNGRWMEDVFLILPL